MATELGVVLGKLASVLGLISIALASTQPISVPKITPANLEPHKEVVVVQPTLFLYKGKKIDVWAAMDVLSVCESGQNPKARAMEKTGYYSTGMFQYQPNIWKAFSEESGITGNPMNRLDSINMTRWALEHHKLSHWSCAKITNLTYVE